jgi:hypothetical protein
MQDGYSQTERTNQNHQKFKKRIEKTYRRAIKKKEEEEHLLKSIKLS